MITTGKHKCTIQAVPTDGCKIQAVPPKGRKVGEKSYRQLVAALVSGEQIPSDAEVLAIVARAGKSLRQLVLDVAAR